MNMSNQVLDLVPEDLPLNDVAPSTDAEWAEALKDYGRDRDHVFSPRPDGSVSPQTRYSKTRLIPRRGLENSDSSDGDDDRDISPTSLRQSRRQAWGLVGTLTAPPVKKCEGQDWANGDEERRRLREFYETEGWLPGPRAGHRSLIRRRKVIRRLGLAGAPEERCERQAIMAQYAKMAQKIFQCDHVGVVIYRDEVQEKYGSDASADPYVMAINKSIATHSVCYGKEKCFIVRDLEADWRFRGMDFSATKRPRFFAAVPLRYLRRDPPVDFGSLAIFDAKPRDKFTHREQEMLAELGNMLVYQLATLQSEALAEKSANMYEESLSYLRRNIITRPAPTEDVNSKSRKGPTDAARRKRRKADPPIVRPPRPKNGTTSEDTLAEDEGNSAMFVKTGPKDSHDAKKKAFAFDNELHNDGAETLRRILKADAVAIVQLDNYQLYFKRDNRLELNLTTNPENDVSNPLHAFLRGGTWPKECEPVVRYTAVPGVPPAPLLGSASASGKAQFSLDTEGAESTVSDYIVRFFKTRRFWWDKTDPEDGLAQRMMAFMPSEAQTLLATVFTTPDGRLRHISLVAWNRPPASFADESRLALPFVYILGGVSMAALSIRKIRSMEESQISYSNLQAHELRTPLHQILAVTQLLRSSMLDLAEAPQSCESYQNSLQQIRDLIPMLDAIDTSGQTLHGIVDNILSFLDLKARDYMQSDNTPMHSQGLYESLAGGPKSLGAMFEEVIHEAWEENTRSRRAALQPLNTIETIFEIEPRELGDVMEEDSGGALRKAVSKILSNAYKFIEGVGCVRISVKDAMGAAPPKGCEGVCMTRRLAIEISDTGVGMSKDFVTTQLGEPWAKEDPFTTGSGLSIHLAYRIIDLMGGKMQISSAPKKGCIVNLEVPLLRRSTEHTQSLSQSNASPNTHSSPRMTQALSLPSDVPTAPRKVGLIGFDRPQKQFEHLRPLGKVIEKAYIDAGCEIVHAPNADLIVCDGGVEELEVGKSIMENAKAEEIVFFIMPGHDPHPEVVAAANRHGKHVRRFAKPILPSVIRQTLSKSKHHGVPHPPGTGSPGWDSLGRKSSFFSAGMSSGSGTKTPEIGKEAPRVKLDEMAIAKKSPCASTGLLSTLTNMWKPKGMSSEEAIACLSLGDYFSSRRKGSLHRSVSNASSGRGSSMGGSSGTPATTMVETPNGSEVQTPSSPAAHLDTPGEGVDDEDEVETPEPPKVQVLVVEDNAINRKILVRILSSKLDIDIHEAQDGQEAVDKFRDLSGHVVVLLDINMPRKDGFQAAAEMRAHERTVPDRPKAHIIAVTALSGEEEKTRGLVESGMNRWMTKPCGRQVIMTAVDQARKILLNIPDEDEDDDGAAPELPRRATA